MAQNTPASTLGLSLLGMGNSSQLQDSMIVEEYLKSLDMFKEVDAKFSLSEHYKSKAIDFVERLPQDATMEEILAMYNKHLILFYDESSGILNISFLHVDPKKAQEILEFLVDRVDYQINEFNRRKAKKQLKFVESEFEKAKAKFEEAARKVEEYQNKHLLLDPTAEATSKSGIIAELEAKLAQKELELATKKRYLNDKNFEIVSLKNEIKEIKKSIENAKKNLTGDQKGRLNEVMFAYEQLKLQLEFATEVYKNALLQLETTKIEVAKNDKTLSIVSKPNLPDGYSYPNKPKVFITILMLTLLLYGIFTMLVSIIRDHKE
jgi:capsular polysaccharide transport system permease protein